MERVFVAEDLMELYLHVIREGRLISCSEYPDEPLQIYSVRGEIYILVGDYVFDGQSNRYLHIVAIKKGGYEIHVED